MTDFDRPLTRRRLMGGGTVLGLAAALGACATTASQPAGPATAGAAEEAALRVYGNLDTLELAPLLLSAQRGDAGALVVAQGGILSLFGKDGDLPNLKAEGRSHAATNSETQGLRYSVANPDLRVIFTMAEGVYRIVARRSAGIHTLADLRGKRVATMPRTSSAYYLHRMLAGVGVSDAELSIVPFVSGTKRPLTAMRQALLDREIDAVTIWEPEMQRCKDALGDDAIEFFDAAAYREQFSLYSTQGHLADPVLRPRIVALVRSLIASSEQIRRDPRPAWPLVSRAARLDIATVERSWPHHTYPGTLLANLLEVLVQEDVWVARETSRAPRSRDELARLIDTSILREALPQAARM